MNFFYQSKTSRSKICNTLKNIAISSSLEDINQQLNKVDKFLKGESKYNFKMRKSYNSEHSSSIFTSKSPLGKDKIIKTVLFQKPTNKSNQANLNNHSLDRKEIYQENSILKNELEVNKSKIPINQNNYDFLNNKNQNKISLKNFQNSSLNRILYSKALIKEPISNKYTCKQKKADKEKQQSYSFLKNIIDDPQKKKFIEYKEKEIILKNRQEFNKKKIQKAKVNFIRSLEKFPY